MRLMACLATHRNRAVLSLLGLMSMARGGIVHADRIDDADIPARAVLYEVWPVDLRVWLWLALGLTAVILAWTPWRRYGWIAVVVMPAQRLLSHAWSLWHYLAPGWPPGMPRPPTPSTGLITVALIRHSRRGPTWANREGGRDD